MSDPTTREQVEVLAIGCGPFNLGLAALASTVDDADVLVVDSSDRFAWHPGLMFDDAKLQVSFLSDLVSLVDPTHPLSFLAYLADVDRLYPFLVREDFFPTRREYEAYLLWVIDRVQGLRFGTTVEEVRWDEEAEHFEVDLTTGADGSSTVIARHVVVGIGTEPFVPDAVAADSPSLIHSADYLFRRDEARAAQSVTVIGSGQSGAEIVADLLEANLDGGPAVRWWTRTPWFAPLDFTKLSLEMTTPAYMEYFHSLPEQTRDEVRKGHWQFHKGVSSETLARLHDLLYRRELLDKLPAVQLRNGVEIEGIEPISDGGLRVRGRHVDTGNLLSHNTDLVIAATGYTERKPRFLGPIDDRLKRDSRGRLVIGANHSVLADGALADRLFVANAEHHAYGVSAPNLDIGAVRNAKILNTVLGREEYRLQRQTAFTSFGVGDDLVVE
ncbi:putative siderophore biosynthesis protein [Gordonia araii NBRC 100433]|uniref:L-lysine N6-monooxygenase MbtG n=1 Tax=Gordonia araii NBRC 100433 TaxID=1073574 RepID=G7GX66_9ACTN|nr:SidA/IucD/PvdA family monooxygenase [Gordonia araii]NNG98178.1 SidA/IucD/PvdA family monooxygenase [Gordonia araii NBRC 100433]GAB08191.1 putative siderophore biosynthesis protein [Gordonia araii NBRC 100433]